MVGFNDVKEDIENEDENLICHLVAHSRVVAVHSLVALHELDQKLHLYNHKFGAKR